MNTVSLILYFTAILPNVSWVASLFATVSVIGFFAFAFFHALASTDPDITESNSKHIKDSVIKGLKYTIWSLIISIPITIAIPDQKTMYMIAASEIGEEVIQTEEAKIIYQDIRDVLSTYKKVQNESQNNK